MGGSSSQTIGQRYFAKLTTFIGNPIEKLIGINFDNRGWIFKPDNDESFLRVESPNLYGDKEGGVAGFIDIHTGTADQLPNATYEKDSPKVSGYPFQSYLLFRGLGKKPATSGGIGQFTQGSPKHYNGSFYHGNSGYMKEMLLWPQRIHVRNDGRPQWYDEKSEIDPLVFNGQYIKPVSEFFNVLNVEVHNVNGIFYSTHQKHTQNFNDPWGKFWEFGSIGNSSGSVNVPLKNIIEYKCNENSGKVVLIATVVSKEECGPPTIEILTSTGKIEDYKLDQIDDVNYSFKLRIEIVSTLGFEFRVAITSIPGVDENNLPVNGLSVEDIDFYSFPERFKLEGTVASDINTIHKIREIITDDTAMNKPESDVNDSNFKKAADRIWDEGLGISWSIAEKSCVEAINELCGHIEAGVRINRQTGLYEMVLFRDDWFADNEIHTLPVNKIKKMLLDGAVSADELINQLNISYYNRDAIKNSSFSVAENASIRNLQGLVNSEDVKFPYFTNQRNPAVVAQWKLKQMSTPVWQGNFTTGFYEARKWNRYDLLKLAWPKKWTGTILVRIMKINLGTGTEVSVDFVEVVPYSTNLSSSIVIDTPVDTTPKPPQAALFKAFELSYFEGVQLNGQKAVDEALAYNPDAGYVAVIAKRPQTNSLNALMYTDNGNDYARAGAIVYSETVELDQNISPINSAFIVRNVGEIDMVSTGTQITVNNEIMVYQSYDQQTGLLTVKRGVLDTIPQNHLAGSILYFADDFVTVDPIEYVTGEIINVKTLTTTPSGILSLDDVDAQQIEIQARAIRPYPPANVKINDEYWLEEIETDLILTWVDRNRVQQTGGNILGWYESGVTIEPETQTHLILTQLDENDVELATTNANVTGTTSYILPISSMQADARTVEIVLKTIRDGYECLNPFAHTVELSQFFSAPYDLTVEFKND